MVTGAVNMSGKSLQTGRGGQRPFLAGQKLGNVRHNKRIQARSFHSVPTVCVTSVTESEFDKEVMKVKGKTVLVDFWATWCGPCKLIDPYMKQLEEEFADDLKVVKVEADPNPSLVEKYKVYGLPTIILFKDGQMVKGSLNEGAITKPMLLKYLEKHGIGKVAAK